MSDDWGAEADALSEIWSGDPIHYGEQYAYPARRPVFVTTKPKKKRKKSKTQEHHPATDAEAQKLIKKLGTFVWDTHKASGYFTHNPYRITAMIQGVHHTIHIPGRFGSTLMWLKKKLDSAA